MPALDDSPPSAGLSPNETEYGGAETVTPDSTVPAHACRSAYVRALQDSKRLLMVAS